LHPLRASCDCDDFLRNSLGLCKHVVAVVDDLATDAKRFARAMGEPSASRDADRLEWSPVRPLAGAGDWTEGVRFVPAAGTHRRIPASIARHWVPSPAAHGAFVLRTGETSDPARRTAVVEDLAAFVARSAPRSR